MARQPKQVFENQESISSVLKKSYIFMVWDCPDLSERIARKLGTLVNSYADAYRVQIHRISGTSDAVVNVGQLQSDLDLLRNWSAASSAEFAEKRV
jgi:hypothetical protein